MINAAQACNYAYKSVGLTCIAEAKNNLYNAIDEIIEKSAKDGKMSVDFSFNLIVGRYFKVELSQEQVRTLASEIQAHYITNGFKVSLNTYSWNRDEITVEIGWL